MNKLGVIIFLYLFFVCLVPFLFYFVNPLLAYYDSYAFLSGTCGLIDVYMLPFVPCNIFFIKLLLFFCFFVSVLSISVFGEQILGKKVGWRAGLFAVAFCPLFFQQFIKFENDVFGLTLGFVSLALFSIALNKNKLTHKALIVFFSLLVLFFAWFLWQPAILISIAMFLLSVYSYFFSILLIIPFIHQIPTYISTKWSFGKYQVLEEMPLIGLFGIIFVLPGLKFIPKKILLPTILLLGLGLWKSKLMILAIPFIIIGFVLFVQKLERMKWFPNIYIISIIMVLVMGFFSLGVSPTQQEMRIVEQSIQLSKDLNVPLYNDWTYGWWITYKGYPTKYRASYPNPDYNNLPRPFVALTKQQINCELIKKENKIKIFSCEI